MIRIGTRESELALWQAKRVASLLEAGGCSCEIVPVKTEGDIDLTTPLYQMGIQGVFTRSLDIALLQKKIDIAVHSMKDVPTQLPAGIVQAAVLERGNEADLFVPGVIKTVEDEKFHNSLQLEEEIVFTIISGTIATSSIRRKAQWLHRYPNQVVEDLRGNVNTRLAKLNNSLWRGAIFAAAGLERIKKRPANAIELKWMLPAPAQGAIMVVCLGENIQALKKVAEINHEKTAACVGIERSFLAALLGGCSTPISAFANITNDKLFFKGNILSPDGRLKAETAASISLSNLEGFGEKMAMQILTDGGKEIVSQLTR